MNCLLTSTGAGQRAALLKMKNKNRTADPPAQPSQGFYLGLAFTMAFRSNYIFSSPLLKSPTPCPIPVPLAPWAFYLE